MTVEEITKFIRVCDDQNIIETIIDECKDVLNNIIINDDTTDKMSFCCWNLQHVHNTENVFVGLVRILKSMYTKTYVVKNIKQFISKTCLTISKMNTLTL